MDVQFLSADADGAMNYNVHGERVGDLLQIAWTRYLPPETAAFDTRLTALTLDGEQIGPPTGALMAGGRAGSSCMAMPATSKVTWDSQ